MDAEATNDKYETTSLYYTTLHYTTLHLTTLRYTTLRCPALLHYITSLSITIPVVTEHHHHHHHHHHTCIGFTSVKKTMQSDIRTAYSVVITTDRDLDFNINVYRSVLV